MGLRYDMTKAGPTLTFMERFLIVLIALLFALSAGCATSKEYKISLDSYNKGQYQEALEHIEQALVEDPQNESYLELKSRINMDIYRDKYRYRRAFLGFE
jgi:tetratricopeptide (TPR) repeat protein